MIVTLQMKLQMLLIFHAQVRDPRTNLRQDWKITLSGEA